METAVLQGKNYEVYLKWAKWLMIMGCVCVILNLILWKFLEWSWIMSEYDAGARYIIFRPYSNLIVIMSQLLPIIATLILRRYPNTMYRTFATRLIVAWVIAIIYYWGRNYVLKMDSFPMYPVFFSYILNFIPSVLFVWAYSILLEDSRLKHASVWIICLFLISALDTVFSFAYLAYYNYYCGPYPTIEVAVLDWITVIVNILYILLWKSLFSSPTDIEINRNRKKITCINRVLVGYVIVSLIYVKVLYGFFFMIR